MPSVSLPGFPSVLDLGLAGSGWLSQRAPSHPHVHKRPIPHRSPELRLLASDPCRLASALSAPRCCASCKTKRTPLWRDAEDGTPLCNACGIRSSKWTRGWGWGPHLSPNLAAWGIGKTPTSGNVPLSWRFLGSPCLLNVGFLHPHPRYKKYGTRCSSCWLVPRKNVQPKKLCGRCGVSLGPHPASAQEG